MSKVRENPLARLVLPRTKDLDAPRRRMLASWLRRKADELAKQAFVEKLDRRYTMVLFD